MIRLLSNQTLRIDSHQSGELRWNDPSQDIHLHKESNNSKKRYIIRIPLNSCNADGKAFRNATISVDGTNMYAVPRRIQKEIDKVLNNDSHRRDVFVKDLYELLTSCGCTDEEMPRVAEHVENIFGLEQGTLTKELSKISCYLRLSEQNNIYYQTIVNNHSNQIYTGQFSLGNMSGIHSFSRQQWESALIGHLEDIFNCESKAGLKNILDELANGIRGIGKRTIENALLTFCVLYNIPD